jgi:hypothetical protein
MNIKDLQTVCGINRQEDTWYRDYLYWFLVFNATFSNISAISWRLEMREGMGQWLLTTTASMQCAYSYFEIYKRSLYLQVVNPHFYIFCHPEYSWNTALWGLKNKNSINQSIDQSKAMNIKDLQTVCGINRQVISCWTPGLWVFNATFNNI